MKPHIKVIQRGGVDVFVTSSMKMKAVSRSKLLYKTDNVASAYEKYAQIIGLNNGCNVAMFGGGNPYAGAIVGYSPSPFLGVVR